MAICYYKPLKVCRVKTPRVPRQDQIRIQTKFRRTTVNLRQSRDADCSEGSHMPTASSLMVIIPQSMAVHLPTTHRSRHACHGNVEKVQGYLFRSEVRTEQTEPRIWRGPSVSHHGRPSSTSETWRNPRVHGKLLFRRKFCGENHAWIQDINKSRDHLTRVRLLATALQQSKTHLHRHTHINYI